MLGDDPVGFLSWMLLLPVVIGALIGLLVGVAFALVAALTGLNHGLARLVRNTADAIRTRSAIREAETAVADDEARAEASARP